MAQPGLLDLGGEGGGVRNESKYCIDKPLWEEDNTVHLLHNLIIALSN